MLIRAFCFGHFLAYPTAHLTSYLLMKSWISQQVPDTKCSNLLIVLVSLYQNLDLIERMWIADFS